MSGKKELKVHIGLAWQGIAPRQLARALEPFFKAFSQTPLTWVLPSVPYLEKRSDGCDKLIVEIKTRLARLKDGVIPVGFSGAPHPLLSGREVEKELEWSLANPWGSGLLDVWKKNPDAIIPAAADLRRQPVLDLYRKKGFRLLGLPAPGPVYSFRGPDQGDGLSVFYYYKLSAQGDASPAKLVKATLPRDLTELFLLVRPEGQPALAALDAFLGELGKRFHIAVSSPDGLGETASRPTKSAPAVLEPADGIEDTPLYRLLREKAAHLRLREEPKNHDLSEILTLTAGAAPETEKARAALEVKPVVREGTAYTANMPGEILLPGNGFDASFSHGRLSTLKHGDTDYLPTERARSSVSLGGKEVKLIFDRIFSFEKNELRGLEAFVLYPGAEREHFFTIRYAFSGDLPWLIISGEFLRRFSAPADRLTGIAPLEIPIAEFAAGDPPALRAWYADGSEARVPLDGCGTTAAAGTVFSLPCRDKHLVFGAMAHKKAPITRLELRIAGDKKRRTAFINPFGTYRPAAVPALLGFGEIRSFYIALRDEEPAKAPSFPASALKTIPAHAVYRLQ